MSGKDIFLSTGQVEPFIERSQPSSRKRISCTWWGWEIASMLASLTCMSGLVVILFRANNRPSASWTSFISLNATVALLMAAAKATLLMAVSACLGQAKWTYFSKKFRHLSHLETLDDASRGPFGALKTLINIPWGWATVGAIIVLLDTTVDVFAQQVFRLEADFLPVLDGFATFGYAQCYDTGTTNHGHQTDDPFMLDDSTVDSAMQGAVLRGFYQNTWSPLFSCTSNCTWANNYTSLGFDSSCSNVTTETLSTKLCSKNGSNVTCNFKPPGNISLTTQTVLTTWLTIAITNSSSLLGEAGGFVNTGDQPDHLASISSGLVRTAVWTNISNTIHGQDDDGLISEDHIIECTLSLVAWKYSNISPITNSFSIGTKENIPLGRAHRLPPVPGIGYPNVDRYWFNSSSIPEMYVLSTNIGALGRACQSTQGVTGAFAHQNVTAVFIKVAESMTGQLQQSNTILGYGMTADTSVVYIHIRWTWLLLPIFVEIAGAALLVSTIFSSRRSRNVHLWKSSPAALLFHSVFPDGLIVSELKGPAELNRRVRDLKIRLV
ncbi:uncharacterized protein RCO7_05700 [Rhynchosporium graminicola]|uniref:Uncharacterized protein n=1 Tax=Rhynchosporium graminicola TaxID=2792576 RepID=A0A1E1KC27_9HELO|nr:uncharacterized protein RCO7_05700 [Rhynchosporium commune]